MKFKVNDIVRVLPRRGDQKYKYPNYVNEMLLYGNKIFEVLYISEREGIEKIHLITLTDKSNTYAHISKFSWHEDWLEKIYDKPILEFSDKEFLL